MENKKSARKSHALLRSSDFLNIKLEGKKKSLRPWLMISYKGNQLGHLRFGCTISGKVGSAVTRNRLKRWTREYFRKAIDDGFDPQFDFNLVFRPMPKDFYKKLVFSEFVEAMDFGRKAF